MSELPEPDDASFRLATGEELVVPSDGADPTGRRAVVPARGSRPDDATAPSLRDRRVAGRLRARKVRRLVRHIEPWSVLKVSLIFYFCVWVILLIAGVLLWSFAVGAGTVDNLENFITELFALESFEFNADEIFRASAIGGLVLVVAGSGFTVLMAVLFNLISDVTGGVRFTVVEEETARPRPKRTRPRHGPAEAIPPRGGPSPRTGPTPVLREATDDGQPGDHPGSGDASGRAGTDVPILPTAAEPASEETHA